MENNLDIVRILIDSGAMVNGYVGASSLEETSKLGNLEMIKVFLEKGADPNLRDIGSNSALMEAAKNGHYQVVKLLLKYGAYVKFRNFDGKTAISLAGQEGHDRVVQILSEHANLRIKEVR